MKAFLLLTITFFALTITCKAQWTTGPGNINNTNTGNVLIGTTTSSNGLLQINGTGDLLSLTSTSTNPAQFNAWNSSDFRIIQRSNGVMTLWTNTIERMRVDQNGNVGIGTTAPAAKLHVLNVYDTNNTTALNLFYQSTWGTAAYASGFRFMDIASTEGGKILELNGYGMGIGCDPPAYLSPDKLYVNGNVAIGTSNSQGYKLAVNGNVIATSMTVKAYANWPDYVFKPTYKLPTLTEVKTYIEQNHHLPDVPSAADVEKNGLNLGEMNKVLVEKVEELTLYLIEKDKQLADQQKINQVVKQQSDLLKSQQKQIDELRESLNNKKNKKTK